ncbi:MAG: enoyl-CoA hydratase/isomerase family protein [Solirubrobacterales bacterium]|jgi:enoyl-CoA hydratase|nr:enoyl-CoA hydratase/isomerase family protein [Solirubrobacterales bacterium]
MPAPYADIRVEQDGGVARLILDAPARRNALTVEMARAMVQACEDLDADPSVGAVVVCGEGAYFCAGGDRPTLAAAGEDPAHPEQFDGMGDIYQAFARVGQLKAPTIAAIRGGAVGAGMNLAMATDLRIVARDAVLASGFIPIGLHPGGGHGVLLGRTGAREATAALMLFGERVDGVRFAELGLAWAAVDAAEVEAKAMELAAVPGADPVLARRTAASMRTELGPPALPWNAALELERPQQMWSMRRKSLQQG